METIIETPNYLWQYDWRSSQSRYVRKADGSVAVKTGPEADEEYEIIQRCKSRVAEHPELFVGRTFEDILECDASEQEYH